ncbi:hypothetical protein [Xanthomarina gelatinilytica]|uniref:hypothetical protein n=1 Tax=Xanthomarina gelatinilytica TaxID=1137281 RepID=UPI003AA93BCC
MARIIFYLLMCVLTWFCKAKAVALAADNGIPSTINVGDNKPQATIDSTPMAVYGERLLLKT